MSGCRSRNAPDGSEKGVGKTRGRYEKICPKRGRGAPGLSSRWTTGEQRCAGKAASSALGFPSWALPGFLSSACWTVCRWEQSCCSHDPRNNLHLWRALWCDINLHGWWSSDLELNQVVHWSSWGSEFLRPRTVLLHVAYLTKWPGLRFQETLTFSYGEFT